MRSCGGSNPSGKDDLFTVSEAIRMFAEDVGLAYTTVRGYRWVSSRWPKKRRRADVSHTIHKVLASVPDEQERFEAVNNPPPNPRGGPPRWTHDSAKRVVGWKVDSPESVQEKVEAIHDLATDDAVAAVVTTDFLRRPAIASKAMADDTARHAVNEAQFDRFRQQAQFVHESAAPQLQRMESTQFMDLVAACAQFVATAGRIVPNLRVERYDDGEREHVAGGVRACNHCGLGPVVGSGNGCEQRGLPGPACRRHRSVRAPSPLPHRVVDPTRRRNRTGHRSSGASIPGGRCGLHRRGTHFRTKLEAIGYGFLTPVFFVASGLRLDLRGLIESPSALLRVPLFLVALLVVRGVPALLYRRSLGTRSSLAAGLLQATSLPFLVTGADRGHRGADEAGHGRGAGLCRTAVRSAVPGGRAGAAARPPGGATVAGRDAPLGYGRGHVRGLRKNTAGHCPPRRGATTGDVRSRLLPQLAPPTMGMSSPGHRRGHARRHLTRRRRAPIRRLGPAARRGGLRALCGGLAGSSAPPRVVSWTGVRTGPSATELQCLRVGARRGSVTARSPDRRGREGMTACQVRGHAFQGQRAGTAWQGR